MTDKTPSWLRWLLLCISLGGAGVTGSLAMWQLDRADEKLDLQTARDQQSAKEVLDNRSLLAVEGAQVNRSELIHRRMVLTGHWLPKYSVFLENRQMNSKPGFFMVTPLRLEGSDLVVIVQRGWVHRSFTDRTALPEIPSPAGLVKVMGYLAPWPSRLYDFGGIETGPIRQNIDISAFIAETDQDLLEVSLLQTGSASEGLLREWPVVASGVAVHYGYAFQWFGLSALIVLLYVWFQIVQPRRKKRTA